MDSVSRIQSHSVPEHFSLTDPFGRKLDYLRLAITERCNLRCTYCMPAEGIPLKSRQHLLSYEEMDRSIEIFLALGINKIRITGGEPFVRKGAFDFIKSVNAKEKINSLNLTTNAVLISEHLKEFNFLKLGSLNISLDSLNKDKFFQITRRDDFNVVYTNLQQAISLRLPVKINMVVMAGINEDEILAFCELTKNYPIEVRFIEQMPFSGGQFDSNIITADQIESRLEKEYKLTPQITDVTSTARIFNIKGYQGRIGIIAGYSRSFCGACNRLRLTADGMLKTCLYDRIALNLKQLLRAGAADEEIRKKIVQAVMKRAKDGFESESRSLNGNISMAQIGG